MRWRVWLLGLLMSWMVAAPATAAVVMSLYSREFSGNFPHAYFSLHGTPDAGGAAVDEVIGFSAKAITPAALVGSVPGMIVGADPRYIAKSKRHASIVLTDQQYAEVLAVVERWRNLPSPSYNLNTRNCVFFFADAARAAGLDAAPVKGMMKKPNTFVAHVVKQNSALIAARTPGAHQQASRTSPAGAGQLVH